MIEVTENRRAGRRASDVTREMLEESLKELPNFLVTVLDDERGLYSFYYQSRREAHDMVESLKREGISAERIAIYNRG
jgi:hypothetical protein